MRVWDSVSLSTLHVLGLGVFDRAVCCVGFSKSVSPVPSLACPGRPLGLEATPSSWRHRCWPRPLALQAVCPHLWPHRPALLALMRGPYVLIAPQRNSSVILCTSVNAFCIIFSHHLSFWKGPYPLGILSPVSRAALAPSTILSGCWQVWRR